MTKPTHRTLSLGGGVQSSVLLLMAEYGETDSRPEVAIFADTGWEPQSVYRHLDWLETQTEIPIVRVNRGRNLGDDTDAWVQHEGRPALSLPVFVMNLDGSKGMLQHRQCTTQYKMQPIGKWITENMLGVAPGRRVPKHVNVETWMGISYDEAIRMKDKSLWPWLTNRYPLVEMHMTRTDCREWFAERYPGRTLTRSACAGCPYRSDEEWLSLKQTDPGDFERAAEIDDAMRGLREKRGCEGTPYLHHRRVPILQAVEQYEEELRLNPTEPGLESGGGNECEGVCFV